MTDGALVRPSDINTPDAEEPERERGYISSKTGRGATERTFEETQKCHSFEPMNGQNS